MNRLVPPGDPLLEVDGVPLVYSALGLRIHLERLQAEDEERLEHVNELVWQWFGEALRTTWLSCAPGAEPTRRSHLDYISTYAAHLRARAHPDPATQQAINNVTKFGRTDYDVSCLGAETPDATSPYSYVFWSEIGEVPSTSPDLPAYTSLEITVPDSWPIDDFFARACAIVAALRIRWASAGFTYTSELRHDAEAPGDQIYAHARRYTGYDVGFNVGMMERFYSEIRTVNWLTFLGPELVAMLKSMKRLPESTARVGVAPVGSALLLHAGTAPERGDVNYLRVPAAYRDVDAMVRPVRASDGRDLVFFGPWDERTITQWLRRFEPGVV